MTDETIGYYVVSVVPTSRVVNLLNEASTRNTLNAATDLTNATVHQDMVALVWFGPDYPAKHVDVVEFKEFSAGYWMKDDDGQLYWRPVGMLRAVIGDEVYLRGAEVGKTWRKICREEGWLS